MAYSNNAKVITNFYAPPESVKNGQAVITGEEARHIASVLRFKKGETISVVDGLGMRYKVVIDDAKPSRVTGQVINQVRRENEPWVNLTLACGISTGTKMDFIIEKCTEVGVNRFIPVLTEQSVVELKDPGKVQKKLTRWKKVAQAAMKQSLRSFLPVIEQPLKLTELSSTTTDYHLSLLASLIPSAQNIQDLQQSQEQCRDILLLIGPEAGFSRQEQELVLERGFVPIRLGKRRLRAETACIIASGLVISYWGGME